MTSCPVCVLPNRESCERPSPAGKGEVISVSFLLNPNEGGVSRGVTEISLSCSALEAPVCPPSPCHGHAHPKALLRRFLENLQTNSVVSRDPFAPISPQDFSSKTPWKKTPVLDLFTVYRQCNSVPLATVVPNMSSSHLISFFCGTLPSVHLIIL